jgi:hypothetical protein
MTAATTYEIGAALGSIATLPSMGIPGVQSEFIDFATSDTLASGQIRARGFPQAEWYCGYLTSDQFDTLRAFCPGASATVCIATMNNDREFVRYDCIMKVPERYKIRKNEPQDFTITFTHLVEAE